MKHDIHSGGIPAGALSPPATLSPPSSPCILPSSPWSPGGPANGSNSSSSGISSIQSTAPLSYNQRLSAFNFVSNYNPDFIMQKHPTNSSSRGKYN